MQLGINVTTAVTASVPLLGRSNTSCICLRKSRLPEVHLSHQRPGRESKGRLDTMAPPQSLEQEQQVGCECDEVSFARHSPHC